MNARILKKKLIFCSLDIWRKIFLAKKSIVFQNQEKFVHHRSSAIPKIFTNYDVSIYTGKKWTKRNISRWMVGFKFGEFTWNKKIAVYKAKQLKKKKN